MKTVVCLKTGNLYGDEYVTKLQSMVAKNLPVEHRFVCFTDKAVEGVECLPPPCDLPGWWGKLGFFREDLPIQGAYLYLDLDVLILSSLIPLFHTHSWGTQESLDFCIIKQWKKKLPRKDTFVRYNSSCMYFSGPGVRPKVWETFGPDIPSRHPNDYGRLRGDQDWIANCHWDEATFPEGWFASFEDMRPGRFKGVKVVLCNKKKNHQITEDWAVKAWN